MVQGGVLRSRRGALLDVCDRNQHDAHVCSSRQYAEHGELLRRRHGLRRHRFHRVYSSSQNYLTDVGAYTASASPYGTYDQNGECSSVERRR